MKSSVILLVLSLAVNLYAFDEIEEITPIGWVSGNMVQHSEEGPYLETNRGAFFLNVLDYHEESDSYLIECFVDGSYVFPSPINLE